MAEFETDYLAHHGVKGFDDSIYSQTMDATDDFLAHYQVKGAKHGIRRYQNYDGTLTAEGRIHYGVGPPREKSEGSESGVKKAAETVKNKIKEASDKRKAKKRAQLGEYLRDHPKKLPRYKRVISEAEADEIIRKINFDRKLQDVKYAEIDRKSDRFNKLVAKIGDFKNLMQYGSTIYNNTANIYNSMLSSGKISSDFITFKDQMTIKYGEDFYKSLTPDERETFSKLKVNYEHKKMPIFSVPSGEGGSGGKKKK